jgi:hypothetical protein
MLSRDAEDTGGSRFASLSSALEIDSLAAAADDLR